MVAKFVTAYESADLDALVAFLTDDVFISMSPMPFEYKGRDIVARGALLTDSTVESSISAIGLRRIRGRRAR